jgi:uncharacterized protein
MTKNEILNRTDHRPFDMPEEAWKFYQEWHNVIFLHWAVNSYDIRQFVPDELNIELFKGVAWVSLVAFRVKGLGPRFLPAFPPISDFDEINLRTYVKYDQAGNILFKGKENT